MRCPKCGYISFDHMEICLKCKKDIKAVSDNLHGTVFNVAAPSFLQINKREAEPEVNDAFSGRTTEDDDFVDEDLEVLVEDEVMIDDQGNEEIGTGDSDFSESDDLENREIEMDLSQFEDAEEPEMPAAAAVKSGDKPEEQTFSLELPAELADISDLAPPARETGGDKKAEVKTPAKKEAVSSGANDLDFDLGLGDLGIEPAAMETEEEMVLSLDDIDFSETPAPKKSSAKPTAKQGGTDMDEDLNFDLDLGGLSIHKDG
ncbi:MAG: hypothetical protein OEL83_05665 [Desulforhopalus sp.]|nr:hypothetical protein [Desulforhopalus sp.]